jgi:hypothetical protein
MSATSLPAYSGSVKTKGFPSGRTFGANPFACCGLSPRVGQYLKNTTKFRELCGLIYFFGEEARVETINGQQPNQKPIGFMLQ